MREDTQRDGRPRGADAAAEGIGAEAIAYDSSAGAQILVTWNGEVMDNNSQPPPPGSWPGSIAVITLFAEEVPPAKEFYRQALGLRMLFEDDNSAVFDAGNMMINVLGSTEAPELILPAAVAPRAAGSRYMLTVEVDDVDATCAQLASRGIGLLNGPMDRPWGRRTASFSDPAGHIWEIASKHR